MDTSQSSEDSDCSDQPQSSKDSKSSKGLTAKTYSGATAVNIAIGEKGKNKVGMEVDEAKIEKKLVNVALGAPGSSLTGFACKKDMNVGNLFNFTGPQTSLEEVARLQSLFSQEAGASTQPEMVKNPPGKINDRRDLDDIINRIEQRTASTYSGYDLPLREFLRPNLPRLCATTGNGIKRLMERLQAMGHLDDETVEELKAMTTNGERCRNFYEIVAQMGAVRPLILALEQSNNRHVIDLIETWL